MYTSIFEILHGLCTIFVFLQTRLPKIMQKLPNFLLLPLHSGARSKTFYYMKVLLLAFLPFMTNEEHLLITITQLTQQFTCLGLNVTTENNLELVLHLASRRH